ncbi:MAG: formimidoylglutamase, partial [Pseudomonadota bacterium]|nr:formimidoylglutamase [Pseudomonadota bacterium]
MHRAADMALWQGRIDAEEGLQGRRWHQVMRSLDTVDGPAVALIGFACDAGVARNHGRSGACDGPAALRAQLA